jgi:hypothetical protein
MIYRLRVGESRILTIQAVDFVSTQKLEVQKEEVYDFDCNPTQRWKDWFISSGPDGFYNPLASLVGLRFKNVKCFALCAGYISNQSESFVIGSGIEKKSISSTGELFFFANDSPKHYRNNRGSVEMKVTRVA